MTYTRSEIQLIVCADLMKLHIDQQISRYMNTQETNR